MLLLIHRWDHYRPRFIKITHLMKTVLASRALTDVALSGHKNPADGGRPVCDSRWIQISNIEKQVLTFSFRTTPKRHLPMKGYFCGYLDLFLAHGNAAEGGASNYIMHRIPGSWFGFLAQPKKKRKLISIKVCEFVTHFPGRVKHWEPLGSAGEWRQGMDSNCFHDIP